MLLQIGSIKLEISPGRLIPSSSSRVETVDCGDEAASWLSDFLRQPCRLIRQNPDFTRDMKRRPSGGTQSTKAHRNARTRFRTLSHYMLAIAAAAPCCVSLLDILSSVGITSVGINSLSDKVNCTSDFGPGTPSL